MIFNVFFSEKFQSLLFQRQRWGEWNILFGGMTMRAGERRRTQRICFNLKCWRILMGENEKSKNWNELFSGSVECFSVFVELKCCNQLWIWEQTSSPSSLMHQKLIFFPLRMWNPFEFKTPTKGSRSWHNSRSHPCQKKKSLGVLKNNLSIYPKK